MGFFETSLTEIKENFGLVMKSKEFFDNLEPVTTNQFLLTVG